jgi:hypothetical protein
VIKDDGTVVDILDNGNANQIVTVEFDDDFNVWARRTATIGGYGSIWVHKIPDADVIGDFAQGDTAVNGFAYFSAILLDITTQTVNFLRSGDISLHGDEMATRRHAAGGLSRLAVNPTNRSGSSLVAYQTRDFCTGWITASTKGAFLSDTDDTDLVGDGTLTAPDRSLANKPLLIVGTIARDPVAPGAELIAYSGFSETNYLEGTDATYADTLYALGWVQTAGVWEFKHGVVSAASIDGLSITGATLKIAGTKPKALVRVTATTPTAAQLAKIQADERFLFQADAACTLYGASDAVTALAHDPDTGLLHVGTSAGRSVFKGLRRVANTTVPVGVAIAAAGGMVVDE